MAERYSDSVEDESAEEAVWGRPREEVMSVLEASTGVWEKGVQSSGG